MTKKIRNGLITIFILAFPFVLFLGFLIFLKEPMKLNPNGPKKTTPPGPVTGTNLIYSPR